MLRMQDLKQVIFDFDGVILDSNQVKQAAITEAASQCAEPTQLAHFVDYFTAHNGVPREKKIGKFFQGEACQQVLKTYNALLDRKLQDAPFTHGFLSVIRSLNQQGIKPDILSGSDQTELETILNQRGIRNSFSKVMGGPSDKFKNLKDKSYSTQTVYFGDSRVDYEVAKRFNLKFVFVYAYSQFSDWQTFFYTRPKVLCIRDLSALDF